MRLRGELARVAELGPEKKREMFSLMSSYFAGLSRQCFLSDLREKEWVILLQDKYSRLQGFSTIMVMDKDIDTQPVRAIFSGDTIINRRFWGDWELFRIFGTFIVSLMRASQNKTLCWFLISMGYRTYAILPLFFNEFYPRYDKPTPLCAKKVLDTLACEKFRRHYSPAEGIISFDGKKEFLKPSLSGISQHKLGNPHVRFFVKKNPFYYRGDELACIAFINEQNLKPMVYRLARTRKEELAWSI
jgi:hypothetical protein